MNRKKGLTAIDEHLIDIMKATGNQDQEQIDKAFKKGGKIADDFRNFPRLLSILQVFDIASQTVENSSLIHKIKTEKDRIDQLFEITE